LPQKTNEASPNLERAMNPSKTGDTKFSIGDLVVHCGKIVGRVLEIGTDGWVKVRDREGRVDEYYAENLRRA
jgi:hypothetical protein